MPAITLYTKSDCISCKMTKRQLDKLSIEYTIISIEENDEAFNHVKNDLGQKSMPVIETLDGQVFSGFRPEKLKELAV